MNHRDGYRPPRMALATAEWLVFVVGACTLVAATLYLAVRTL